jgi:methylated-DNA-[protein]-cysteine S-methyltransferase
MPEPSYALFDTPIGRCAIAWSHRGLVGVQLPEAAEQATKARVRERFPGAREAAPPPEVQRAVACIVALLRGEPSQLDAVALDMAGVPPFARSVYEVARTIAPGTTITYGDVATRLGKPGSARAVGQALGKNPFAIVIPCHRVMAAGGKVGGFSANGGTTTKLRLLSLESERRQGTLFDGDGAFAFDPEDAVNHVREADPVLARLVDQVGPFRMGLKKTPSLFGALAEAIVYQQLSGKAAATIYGRVRALFPDAPDGPNPDQVLAMREEALRGAGLSRGKLASLRDLAAKAAEGRVPTIAAAHRMENEALIEQLTEVRGIGRWTVEMLLMFRLGRPDVLPVDDYGIRKGFAVAFRKRELPTKQLVVKRGARWAPFRTVASWYLWRASELDRKKSV